MVVFVVLRSGPAFAAASVVAASEALRSAVVSAGVRLVEAASVAWGSQAPDSAAQFAWQASVVVAFVGAGRRGWGLPLAGVGLGLGYYGYSSYYSDPCVVWDGYTWVDACY